MTLLKSLQQTLTCTSVPWLPPKNPTAARLINEIVLGEECDEVSPGRYLSHFAWYLEAMEEVGANTRPVRRFLARLAAGTDANVALSDPDIPEAAAQFTRQTLQHIKRPPAVRLACFFYGREDALPELFERLVQGLAARGMPCSILLAYLRRHIEVDAAEHGPIANSLLQQLLEEFPLEREAAMQAASAALSARLELWNAVLHSLPQPAS